MLLGADLSQKVLFFFLLRLAMVMAAGLGEGGRGAVVLVGHRRRGRGGRKGRRQWQIVGRQLDSRWPRDRAEELGSKAVVER